MFDDVYKCDINIEDTMGMLFWKNNKIIFG